MNNLPTQILSCACITAFCACITALLLIFELSRIVTALGNIRVTLDIINRNLALLCKQRGSWLDQNGFKHWRKKDA